MKGIRYDSAAAKRLAPLLTSIAGEMEERRAALVQLESALSELDVDRSSNERARELVAEIAGHRRELRHVLEEVHGLGCSVLGTDPPTFRIPTQGKVPSASLVYQARQEDGR